MSTKRPAPDLSLQPKPPDPFKPKAAPKARVAPSVKPAFRSLADLLPDPENPREIDAENAEGLAYSLEEFGDLSGIVFNIRTKQLVAGHQRVEQLGANGDLPIRWDEGRPFVVFNGEAFPIRFVDWDREKQRAANIAANNPHIAGRFTKALGPQLEEMREKSDAMFQALKLHKLQPAPLPDFRPGSEENQGKLDILALLTCPHCNKQFRRN